MKYRYVSSDQCFGYHNVGQTGLLFGYISKIATIQEKTNFPKMDNTLPARDNDLERREGFARHTLVGLNVFFMSLSKQSPHVLGIPQEQAG